MEWEARRVEKLSTGWIDESVAVVDRLADSKGHLLRVSRSRTSSSSERRHSGHRHAEQQAGLLLHYEANEGPKRAS